MGLKGKKIKTTFEIHEEKYLEFKNTAAITNKFSRGYTKKSIIEALDLYIYFNKHAVTKDQQVMLGKILEAKGYTIPEDPTERIKMVVNDLLNVYFHVHKGILEGQPVNFRHPVVTKYRTTLNSL